MRTIRLIGKRRNEVCIKPFDFYSFGHIIMGTYILLITAVITFLIVDDILIALLIGLIGCFIGGIGWEFFENMVLVNTKYKFNRVKDSLVNSLTDQILVMIGAIIQYNICLLPFNSFILFTIIFSGILWSLYFYCKRRTLCE